MFDYLSSCAAASKSEFSHLHEDECNEILGLM